MSKVNKGLIRKRATPGDIVKIVFDDGLHTYGRLLVAPCIEIFDARSSQNDAPFSDGTSFASGSRGREASSYPQERT